MCNPPFYASNSELLASAAAKSRPPHSACTGAEVEMVTPGGEISFISRMIDESVALKTRVQWYTSMLGKLSSVGDVVEKLKSVGVDNWAVTEFVQGQKTRRWAVAWSWGPMRPRQVRESSHDILHTIGCRCSWEFAICIERNLTSVGYRSQHHKSTQTSTTVPMRTSVHNTCKTGYLPSSASQEHTGWPQHEMVVQVRPTPNVPSVR